MGLQTPSAPSVPYPTPPSGTLCSVQWLAASIHFCICQALAEPLRKQPYQAPVSKHFLASAIVSGFGGCIWDESPVGAVSGWPFLQSLLHTLSPYFLLYFVPPSKKHRSIHTVVFLLLRLHMVCELNLGYSKLLDYPLISEYILCVFFWDWDWVTSLRMIFSSSIHLPANFMKSLFVNVPHFPYLFLC